MKRKTIDLQIVNKEMMMMSNQIQPMKRQLDLIYIKGKDMSEKLN